MFSTTFGVEPRNSPAARGYMRFEYQKFEIDIDIPKPKSAGMGTYTAKAGDGERLQISWALLMLWYFVVAMK